MTPIETTPLVEAVYDAIIDDARLPSIEEIAQTLGTTADAVRDAIRHARLGKTILLHPTTGELWMAGPFSAVPTDHVVTSGGKSWWANCAWDALGVGAIVGARATVHSVCSDCNDPITLDFEPSTRSLGDLLVHFLVPARRWYDDVGFT